jgi:nucleoid-associated protein YgaU
MPKVSVGNITCTEGKHNNEKVEFHFNPTEYTVAKANKFNLAANKGGNVPKWEFYGGDPRLVALELLFDSSISRTDDQGKEVEEPDVRVDVNKLFDFMVVDDTLKAQDGRDSHMGRPPQCRLQWARDTKNHFPCYIVSCEVQYILFSQDGIPIRAKARLALHEALDPEKLGGTNPTSRGEPGRKVRQVQEGDRLDWIAFQEFGDPNEWRLLADANRLFDPLHLPPGMTLVVPPR